MAIVKNGSLVVAASGAAQNLILGFTPTRFTMWNQTLTTGTPSAGVVQAMWLPQLANGTAWIYTSTVTSGALALSLLATNGITPYTTPANLVYPSSNLAITAITNAAQAQVTAVNGFTANDVGVTVVTFHNVIGMPQINTLSGVVQSIVTPGSVFTVNINTSSFSVYTSGGIANVITGIPALQGGLISSGNAPGFPPLQSNTSQILNTALYNTSVLGLTLGSGLMVTANNVWLYEAVLDSAFTSE